MCTQIRILLLCFFFCCTTGISFDIMYFDDYRMIRYDFFLIFVTDKRFIEK